MKQAPVWPGGRDGLRARAASARPAFGTIVLTGLLAVCAAPQAAGRPTAEAAVLPLTPVVPGKPAAVLAAATAATAASVATAASAAPNGAPDPPASAGGADPTPATAAPADVRTRHATFRHATFDDLPGWQQDDLVGGWTAFRSSCAALQRRESWRELCAQSASVARTPVAVRAFFESRFALLRILNADASREGEITGYFEPLLEGRRQAQGAFTVPVLGLPRDLYTLDWMSVPAAQRRGVVQVKAQGGALAVVPAGEPGSVALDLSRFDLDTKDRRLRVRLSGTGAGLRADPYPSRGEMTAPGLPGGVDAPVLAWVSDTLGLYAMQIQGSGRIRLPDATVLRVQYADQNGHPFKPFRVVAKSTDRVVTRGIGGAASEVDEFVLEADDIAAAASDRAQAPAEPNEVVTRGIATKRPAAPGGPGLDAAANALVDELLGGRPRRAPPTPAVSAASPPVAPAVAPAVASVAAPAPAIGAGPRKPAAPATAPAAPAPQASARAGDSVAATRPPMDPARLAADPSYVFFKVAADQTPVDGPPGALGVPLTPGRSVAVDPRVTPLGYPVFLAAPAPQGSDIDMRRLVFAQDTGGAIRGAVRADFFWGFGHDAGRLARGTRHRGQMWLLVPKADVAKLASGGVVTRGISAGPRAAGAECLVADEAFCQEPE